MKFFLFAFLIVFSHIAVHATEDTKPEKVKKSRTCPDESVTTPDLEVKNQLAIDLLSFLKIDINDVESVRAVPNTYSIRFTDLHKGLNLGSACNTGVISQSMDFVVEARIPGQDNCIFETKFVKRTEVGKRHPRSPRVDLMGFRGCDYHLTHLTDQ